MTSFADFATAAALRDLVRKLVAAELEIQRPSYVYAIVTALSTDNRTCEVAYPGEEVSAEVAVGAIKPTAVGQVVRIDGRRGDRYVADALDGALGLSPSLPSGSFPSPAEQPDGRVLRTLDGALVYETLRSLEADNSNEVALTVDGTSLVLELTDAIARTSSFRLRKGQFHGTAGVVKTTGVPPEGTLLGAPLVLHAPEVIDQIRCQVTTAGGAGALVRMGIYSLPASGSCMLYGDAGTVDAATGGIKTLTVSDQQLPAGIILPVAVVQGAATTRPTLRQISMANGSVQGAWSEAANPATGSVLSLGTVPGALPASLVPAAAAANAPLVEIRVKS